MAKLKNARTSIDCIRAVMSHFQGEACGRRSIAPSRKLWTALHALDGYLTGQSAWRADYAERHRAGSRVGTVLTEGTANFLVNRRMNGAEGPRAGGQPVAGPGNCGRSRRKFSKSTAAGVTNVT